jgi:hypothetical protein
LVEQALSRKEAVMSFDSDAATIQRLEALAHDQQYLRMNTLRMAGSTLQTSEQDVVEQLFNELDKDIVGKGSDLYSAYEALYAAIAREVVEVGRELSPRPPKERQEQRRGPRHDSLDRSQRSAASIYAGHLFTDTWRESRPVYWIRLTSFGQQFYRENWQRYRDLYPNVEAPEPDREPLS